MLETEAAVIKALHGLDPSRLESAKNLSHYIALRRHDIRELQDNLAALGLSSLGRCESHVMSNIDSILGLLSRLGAGSIQSGGLTPSDGFMKGRSLLDAHTRSLLGEQPENRNVYIMVTMSVEAATDFELVRDLLKNGMNCMRINCAHDDAEAWLGMVSNLGKARTETGNKCRILMDLPGPKLRTGPIEPGPEVIKYGPRRNHFGVVTRPARVWLTPAENLVSRNCQADACIPVVGGRLTGLKEGSIIKFFDTRGASRSLKIVSLADGGVLSESDQTAYVATDTALHIVGSEGKCLPNQNGLRVGRLPAKPQRIHLNVGDRVVLTRELTPGRPATFGVDGTVSGVARIGVTLPELFSSVRTGERILIDDGKVSGLIRNVSDEEVEVEITDARVGGAKLQADKGINLPDSELQLPPLTDLDKETLPFIAKHADMVGYSFVNSEEGILQLQERLTELGGQRAGIVLKIESKRAFERLPGLILAALRSPAAGVMIARGDLAVECGFERMAELQEEILWVCEAAHMPVIWATQVLENLAKEGLPSRSEVTDAAMGVRAECVMLNKGDYIVEAVRSLADILQRMQYHQSKKKSMLRHLKLADRDLSPKNVSE
jgi:pyruvate kinase